MYSKKLIDGTLETFWEINGKARLYIKLSLIIDQSSNTILSRYCKDDIVMLKLNINSISEYSVNEFNIYFNTTFAGKPYYLTIPYSSIFQLVNEEFGSVLKLPVEITEPKKERSTGRHLKVVK